MAGEARSERAEDGRGRDDRLVGRSMRRVEDARFLTGAGCYVADFTPEGTCHAVVVRSPVAHARLGAIRAAAAIRDLPLSPSALASLLPRAARA